MAKVTYRKKMLFPLFAPSDAEAVQPILAALKAEGFPLAPAGKEPGKGGVMLLFLSEKLREDPALVETFIRCDGKNVDTVPINLDGSKPPELIENALYSRNTIFAQRYAMEELVARISTATPFEGKPSPLPILLAVAAAVLVITGIVILVLRLRPAAEATAPEPSATTVPTPAPILPAQAGLLLEDLEKVYELVIIGEKLKYLTTKESILLRNGNAWAGAALYANRTEEDRTAHWYSKEDGHEIEMAAWNDLDFLRYMPNVRMIAFVRVQGELPDLSKLENLEAVELYECDMAGVNGLTGSRISSFAYSGSTLTDFSPLSACARLRSASLTLFAPIPADLTSFCPPGLTELFIDSDSTARSLDLGGLEKCSQLSMLHLDSLPLEDLSCLSACKMLRELELVNLPDLRSLKGLGDHQQLVRLFVDHQCESLSDMSALSDNTSLSYVELHNEALLDLSWLSNAKSLEELELWHTRGVHDLRGLEDHARLRRMHVEGCDRLVDVSALQACSALREIILGEVYDLSDISPLVKLPNLRNLQIYGSQLEDVNFLHEIVNKGGFSFGTAEVADWSGLEAITNYAYLNVTDRSGNALPYLKGATINTFELWCRSGISNWSREPLDWSMFPNVTQNLTLHGVVSLEGMPALPITGLFIDDSQRLTSLNGIQALAHGGDGMIWLNVKGCPRLTDWSALEGMRFAEICCENTFTLPNFAAIDTNSIKLMEPVDLFDLHCFDDMDPDRNVSIELFQTMDVTDLSPLYRLKNGNLLQIPAHLQEQAQLLVESGNFKSCEVVYPDQWWEPAQFNVQLLSFEELDTLPSAVLKRIKDLQAVGDVIFTWDEHWLDQQWDDNGEPTFVLRANDGNESHTIVIEHPGTMTDFSKLSALTGLENLTLEYQTLESIDGIQNLQDLRSLDLGFTSTLTDASPAFTLQELENIRLQYTGVTSIQGIQNLQNLHWLDLNGLKLDDLAPLGTIPEDCNFSFDFPLMTFDALFALPEAVLCRIQEIGFFGGYVTKDPWGYLWFEEDWNGSDKPTLYLHDNETDERIPVGQGPITDLGFLTRLPNLECLYLYAQPIESLDGIETAEKLRRFNSRWTSLSDLSPLFDLEQMQAISVENTETVTSIEGVQKLRHLTELNIGGNNLTDIRAIGKIDYTFCMEPDEGGWIPYFTLGVDNLQGRIPDEQYAALSAVPEYSSLNVFNTDCTLWMEAVREAKIHEIHAGNCSFTNETFKTFIEQHPELEYIKVSWTERLTDISPLLSLRNLRAACVSNDMQQAIRSLGDEYAFQLEVE